VKTHTRVTLLTGLALALAGSASSGTKIVMSWKEPSAGTLKFTKVLVLMMAPHESQRQFGESRLVQLMTRTKGVAAHSLLSQDDVRDEAKVRALMAREGFDGALTMAFLGAGVELSEEYTSYVGSSGGFYDYYSATWPIVYSPGYVRMDRAMQMDTRVYAMKDARLVWYGLSKTMNPKSAQELVDSVAKAVAADLRKKRVIE
jgi:hypothetical protein